MPSDEPTDVGLDSTSDLRKPSHHAPEHLQPARRLSWAEKILPLPSLPAYTGRYSVGTLDLEISATDPRTIGGLKLLDGSDALRLETSLFTVFYPTEAKSGKRLSWLGTNKAATSAGYAKFAGISAWLVYPLAILVAGFARLPAFLNAPLLREEKGKRRLVLFSHGLAGYRTVYSQFCGELASRGYVVAAIEHRDGSGPASFVNYADNKKPRHVEFFKSGDIREDTRLEAIEMRKIEVEMRAQEVAEAFRALRQLNETGEAPTLCRGAARTRVGDVDWSSWKGAIDTSSDVVLSGHSFGGSSVIHASRTLPAELLDAISHAVILDPWLEPLPKSSRRTTLPVLAINSPGFTRWKGHFPTLQRIIESAAKSSILATLGGSVHTNFSDFPCLLPRLTRLRRRTAPKIDPRHAIDICATSTIAFIEGNIESSPLSTSQGAEVADSKSTLDEPGKLYLHVAPS